MKFQPARQSSESPVVKQLKRILPACLVFIVFILYLRAVAGPSSETASPTAAKIPRKIWQSWKVDPLRFEQRDSDRAKTWTTKNPSYRYEVLTDDNALGYVEDHFGPSKLNRPDVVHTYKELSDKIIKSDLLRYLIMYAEGGIYADIDVETLKPLYLFIPDRFDERDIDMVIGVETDEPGFLSHPVLGSKSQSFVQWTFMCKPRLPVMMRLIDDILAWLNDEVTKQGRPISEIQLDFDQVLSGTGPSAFTKAILIEMSKIRGEKTEWSHFHNLLEAKLVGRVLVLTSEAFAAGTGHSDSGNHGGKSALIKHHFHASSWPTSHPRYKHPVYGEVEKCNWNPECVKMWDANTKFFDSLPAQEQVKLTAMKELEDLEKARQDAVAEDSTPEENSGFKAQAFSGDDAPEWFQDGPPPWYEDAPGAWQDSPDPDWQPAPEEKQAEPQHKEIKKDEIKPAEPEPNQPKEPEPEVKAPKDNADQNDGVEKHLANHIHNHAQFHNH